MLSEVAKENQLVVTDQKTIELQHLDKVAEVKQLVEAGIKEEIVKVQAIQKHGAMMYRYPNRVNQQNDPERKPGSDVPFSFLRRMAQVYPIARACINRRIRQITQLQWDITTIDEIDDEEGNEEAIKQIKEFFKHPTGHGSRMRKMLTTMIDDILTVDAVCFEVQGTRGGGFYKLIQIDPTTIALRVTDTGDTPEPPDTAYEQIIAGTKIAEFTTDEMIYDFMGSRSMTPYGLAPLESLILQVEAALRGTLYNLNYFRESNVPEGFLTLPESVAKNKEQVDQWQTWFDALMAGDPRFQHRLKILPEGAVYTPAKKPEDMAFERFELWLLQQTCAVFDVPPQDIGITYQVNKATGETQAHLSIERGLVPLANFIKEIFDDIIQNRMGMENLQFIWHDVNPVDRKEEVEIAEKEINMGVLSGDEYRIEHGREPIGLEHYVAGKTPILVKDIISGKAQEDKEKAQAQFTEDNEEVDEVQDPEKKESEKEQEQKIRLESLALRKWRNCLYNDVKLGRPLRKHFKTNDIDKETYTLIQERIPTLKSFMDVKLFFDQFLDPEVKASMTLLKFSRELKELEHESQLVD